MRVFRFCYDRDDNNYRYGAGIYRKGRNHVADAGTAANFNVNGTIADDTHPTPMGDPGLKEFWEDASWEEQSEWFCACDSLESLCRWFYGYKGVEYLLAKGAFVEEWDTHYYRVGRFQTIFKREESNWVRVVPAEEVLAVALAMPDHEETTKKELTEAAEKVNVQMKLYAERTWE